MARNLVEEKEAEKVKKVMKDKEVLPGLETPDSTDPSFFKMRSGNSPIFKHMGSSPVKAIDVDAIVGASASAAERPDMSDIYENLAEDAQEAIKIAMGTERKKEEKEEEEDNNNDDNDSDDGGGDGNGDAWA